jgi:hypothetical protein
MAKRRKIANTVADPTSPAVKISIQGKDYFLCFDLGALAEAKQHFAEQGKKINLLRALGELDVDSLMVLFPCAIHKHHPELSFEDAQKLITFHVLYAISGAVLAAWRISMPAPDPAPSHPPKP